MVELKNLIDTISNVLLIIDKSAYSLKWQYLIYQEQIQFQLGKWNHYNSSWTIIKYRETEENGRWRAQKKKRENTINKQRIEENP